MSALPASELIDGLLSIIPSLPRPVLDRLVTNMIDRMDEMDGDPDLEDDECEPERYLAPPSRISLPGARSGPRQQASRLLCRHVPPRYRQPPDRARWRKWMRH